MLHDSGAELNGLEESDALTATLPVFTGRIYLRTVSSISRPQPRDVQFKL